ncbi:MAG: hypothetical protein QUS35_11020 [bacterium]|nr:hypothetical protein [bacterium]
MISEKMKRYQADLTDLGLTKFAVFAVTLLAAKWWPVLTSLPWFCYLAVGLLMAARPMAHFLKTTAGK